MALIFKWSSGHQRVLKGSLMVLLAVFKRSRGLAVAIASNIKAMNSDSYHQSLKYFVLFLQPSLFSCLMFIKHIERKTGYK